MISEEDDDRVDATPREASSYLNKPEDLIPGVYEGGLKTWECSVDLASYLAMGGGLDDWGRVLEVRFPITCCMMGSHISIGRMWNGHTKHASTPKNIRGRAKYHFEETGGPFTGLQSICIRTGNTTQRSAHLV